MKAISYLTTAAAAAAVTAAVTAAALLGSAAAASAAIAPAEGVGVQLLTAGPAGAPDYGRPDVYIGTQDDGLLPAPLAPGATATYQVTVTNTGTAPESLALRAAPATTSPWLPQNTGTSAATAMITTTSAAARTVAPGASYTATITVTIPARAKPGNYDAVLWAAMTQPLGHSQVQILTQAGIRALITVS